MNLKNLLSFFIVFLCSYSLIFCDTKNAPFNEEISLFDKLISGRALLTSGTFFPENAINTSEGEFTIFPVATFAIVHGEYNSNWQYNNTDNHYLLQPALYLYYGINSFIDLEASIGTTTGFKKNASATSISDSEIAIGFQIQNQTDKSLAPFVRIILEETFPTGKYKNLNPERKDIDSSGLGSFQTTVNLALQSIIPREKNPVSIQLTLNATHFAPVKVSGFNVYGGGYGAVGTVKPGVQFNTFFSLECGLSDLFVLGLDAIYSYQKKTTFSGNPGFTTQGEYSSNHMPCTAEFFLTPQFEISFSENGGGQFGLQQTITGKNINAQSLFFGSYYYSF